MNDFTLYDPIVAEKVTTEGIRIMNKLRKRLELITVDFSQCQDLERDMVVQLNDVFENVTSSRMKPRVNIGGDLVKMTSQRYKLFSKSTACVTCGCDGTFFIKEKHRSDELYHLNLYAIVDGFAVLMTKDHIMPKSKGGKNHLSNYQTMCQPCNQEKADTV